MRDPARIDRICNLLRAYWHTAPDLRLGQIVGNFTPPRPDGDPGWTYYVEDDVIEKALLADAGPAKEPTLPPIPIDLIRTAREWAFSDALRSLMPMDVRMAMAQVLADCLEARRGEDAGPAGREPK